jgi:outer membrane receptor protein involved in Fe transport
VADGTRNAGTVFAYDEWKINRAVTLTYGARYAHYGYVEGSLFSPRARLEIRPVERFTLAVAAGRREEAPGAEEFLPSGMPGPWLPPELTFSPLAGGPVSPERTEHYEVSLEHRLGREAATAIGVRAFRQRTDDQIATLFGLGPVQRTPAELGHYYVASAGDVTVRGWGVTVSRDVMQGVRGKVDYRVSTAHWQASDDATLLALALPALNRHESERLHDVTTSIETQIPQTATRVFALYRISSAPTSRRDDAAPGSVARFDVRVTQSLPFLDFTNAEWEMLLGVRNLFREMLSDGSVYDELLVVRPPKRVVGGLTVRF